MRSLTSLIFFLAASTAALTFAAELQPAFPNYALQLAPSRAASRENAVGAPVLDAPFSWPQVLVVHEGESNLHLLHGFDPDLQPLQYALLQRDGVHVEVRSFDITTGLIGSHTAKGSAGNVEAFPFQVIARGITSAETYNLIYDVRNRTEHIRLTPVLSRSPGTFIRPGQTVRYMWTRSAYAETHPKCEALLVSRGGAADGNSTSILTGVLGVKVQPSILGYYLMTVTPRDVRGEPPRGSTSNGLVFNCAFGSDLLPPVTDGLAASNFMPAVNENITVEPVATDPQTGSTSFDKICDFGDGTIVSGADADASHSSVAHTYTAPGIYRVRVTVAYANGPTAVAEDSIIVGATRVPNLSFRFKKYILPEEGGAGVAHEDWLLARFKAADARPGDHVVFLYNRNQFGSLSASDGDTDIFLGPQGEFSGSTNLANGVQVFASSGKLKVVVQNAQFDRTGDPRFNRAELRGIFRHQRIAACMTHTDGTRSVVAYAGNMHLLVKGGDDMGMGAFVAEESVTGRATTLEPNPKTQEDY